MSLRALSFVLAMPAFLGMLGGGPAGAGDGGGIGNRVAEDIGDGGPATDAVLSSPGDVLWDGGELTLLIADTGHHRVRRVSDGIITTIIGTGEAADSGDGGPASEAAILSPHKLALDAEGNLYVAGYDRIRKIDTGGIIATVAGGAPCCEQADGVLATDTHIAFPLRDIALDPEDDLYWSELGSIYGAPRD